jgi:hypothetical protein
MVYDRPIGIPYLHMMHEACLPQSTDDSYISQDQRQPKEVPSVNAFYISSIRLYYAMDEILERLHKANAMGQSDVECGMDSKDDSRQIDCDSNPLPLLTTIVQLDGILLKWHHSLPPFLKFSLDSVKENNSYATFPWLQRQRTILRNRFVGMRILLHRQTVLFLLQPSNDRIWPQNAAYNSSPLFSDISSKPSEIGSTPLHRNVIPSSLEDTIAQHSASICVSSALLQIESIDALRPLKLTGAWWWDFHCKQSLIYLMLRSDIAI